MKMKDLPISLSVMLYTFRRISVTPLQAHLVWNLFHFRIDPIPILLYIGLVYQSFSHISAIATVGLVRAPQLWPLLLT